MKVGRGARGMQERKKGGKVEAVIVVVAGR